LAPSNLKIFQLYQVKAEITRVKAEITRVKAEITRGIDWFLPDI
jgi:hypothetical protein